MPKQIAALICENPIEAWALAKRGKVYSETEDTLDLLYTAMEEHMKTPPGQKMTLELMMENANALAKDAGFPPVPYDPKLFRALAEKMFMYFDLKMAGIVMDAIHRKDSDKIYEIARAVKFHSSKQEETGDGKRERILNLKRMLQNDSMAALS